MKVRILIDERTLTTVGSHYLTGYLANKYGEKTPEEIEISFASTSHEWRRKNGGPSVWLVYEDTIVCLMEDVASLIGRGIKIQYTTYDPAAPGPAEEVS